MKGGPRWMAQAACAGLTEVFFGPPQERARSRIEREARAREVCQTCPVIVPCRRHARQHLEYGFWGGESEDERAEAGFLVGVPRSRRAG